MKSRRFDGKVAVVTGSGRPDGLGAAIALRLAAEGCAVVISDIGASKDAATPSAMIGASEAMKTVAQAVRAAGADASTLACDVRDGAEVRALADHAVAVHGGLDIWVNNAGIGYIMKPLLEVEASDWSAVIDVNLSGAFHGLQAGGPGHGGPRTRRPDHQYRQPGGQVGLPFAQAYCASKHGLVGLVRSAAIELGPHGITVNNVCPNHVTTGLGAWQNDYFAAKTGRSVEQYLADMAARIPMGRPGLPGDTADAVAFLASDEARYITAESLNVSGGEEPH